MSSIDSNILMLFLILSSFALRCIWEYDVQFSVGMACDCYTCVIDAALINTACNAGTIMCVLQSLILVLGHTTVGVNLTSHMLNTAKHINFCYTEAQLHSGVYIHQHHGTLLHFALMCIQHAHTNTLLHDCFAQ